MSPLAFAWRGLVRQPGRAVLGIAGIAATGALLFDMLLLSQGLVISMDRLLTGIGFDIRVTATQAPPLTGPPITELAKTVATVSAIPAVQEVVALRIGNASIDAGTQSVGISLLGVDAVVRRPWTLIEGRDIIPHSVEDVPALIINRNVARKAGDIKPGATLTLRGECIASSSVPPVVFRIQGIAEFPFDDTAALTAATTLRNFAGACGDTSHDQADLLMIVSRAGNDSMGAANEIRRVRPDLTVITNEELVSRFQQVEFSYFRQISFVLATITMFFGLLLITVLLSVSTNQRLGEIAALRALGFSRRRMVRDVLWRSALLVGTGGLLALPLGLALSIWLDALLQQMPGLPANLRFFVFAPGALVLYVALLAVTTAVAAIYPIRIVSSLPIASTLRAES